MRRMPRYPSVDGKVVFVTGGASGIGAEIVRAFVAQGAKVGFVDLDEAGGNALLSEIGEGHAFATCDLRDIAKLKSALDELAQALGPAQVLVNNAAHDDRHDWRDVTEDFWDERMATDLHHMFFAIQSITPMMIEAGRGSIINIGSNFLVGSRRRVSSLHDCKVCGVRAHPTMARDLGKHRIRV